MVLVILFTQNLMVGLFLSSQAVKTAVESACMLLRIDDVVSGLSNAMVKAEAEVCINLRS